MTHKVTLEEITPAMEAEIILASSYDSRKNKSKIMTFHPSELKYQVRFYDGKCETIDLYSNPSDAVERYNEHDA